MPTDLARSAVRATRSAATVAASSRTECLTLHAEPACVTKERARRGAERSGRSRSRHVTLSGRKHNRARPDTRSAATGTSPTRPLADRAAVIRPSGFTRTRRAVGHPPAAASASAKTSTAGGVVQLEVGDVQDQRSSLVERGRHRRPDVPGVAARQHSAQRCGRTRCRSVFGRHRPSGHGHHCPRVGIDQRAPADRRRRAPVWHVSVSAGRTSRRRGCRRCWSGR